MKIIKFTALWCADCIVMRPVWKEIAEKFPMLAVVEYDFDEQKEAAEKYGVVKVPHTIFFASDGSEIASFQGMKNKADLLRLIEENLEK